MLFDSTWYGIHHKFTVLHSVVDSHHFDVDPDADPDSTYHPIADPGYQNDADPDPDANQLLQLRDHEAISRLFYNSIYAKDDIKTSQRFSYPSYSIWYLLLF